MEIEYGTVTLADIEAQPMHLTTKQIGPSFVRCVLINQKNQMTTARIKNVGKERGT